MPADRAPVDVDLARPRRVHVVNVGGAGMSAIATVLVEMGHAVSGTDDRETPFLAALRELGVDVTVGAAHPSLAGVEIVVTSTATPPDHPDVVDAPAGTSVAHRGDALAAVCAAREVVAVAGTHGKSTTSALLATVLAHTADDAGFLVGTTVTGLGTNASWGGDGLFVVEADESDGTFLRLGAAHAIVTNLEADHLSFWGTEAALVAGFEEFVARVEGLAVLCLDDPGSAALVAHARRPVTYGTAHAADHRVTDVAARGLGVAYTHHWREGSFRVEVPAAPGIHNARNASAAVALALELGHPPAKVAEALGRFAGVARRFEQRGEAAGVTFVDSYDHLPTEVAAALAAARSAAFERVVCVFQPHRYTRTRDLAHTFADAFVDVDVLGVTELYPAGEAPIEGISGRLVLDAVTTAHPDADARFLPDLDAAVAWLVGELRPGDLCITLNAGDLTTVPDRVIERLSAGVDPDRT